MREEVAAELTFPEHKPAVFYLNWPALAHKCQERN